MYFATPLQLNDLFSVYRGLPIAVVGDIRKVVHAVDAEMHFVPRFYYCSFFFAPFRILQSYNIVHWLIMSVGQQQLTWRMEIVGREIANWFEHRQSLKSKE